MPIIRELAWFECSRCKYEFRSAITGKYLYECNHSANELCFEDVIYGKMHENSYINPLKNKRLCFNCRKGNSLI